MSYLDDYKLRLERYGENEQESTLNFQKETIKDSFTLSPSYFKVLINDSVNNYGVHLIDDSNVRDQKLAISLDYRLQNGDIINWQDDNWINILTDNMSDIYYRGTIRRCNGNLNWQDSNKLVVSYPFTFKSDPATNFGTEDGRIMVLGNERRTLLIKADEKSKKIIKGKRFIFDSRAWKTTALDMISVKGLILITVEESEIDPSKDNLELEIADYIPPSTPPVEPEPIGYSLAIVGSDNIKKGMNQTYSVVVYADGVAVTNKTVVWQLYDVDGVSATEHGTIASQTGTQCTINAGLVIGKTVLLKVSLADDSTVFVVKEIKIKGLY
ncbi:hypothetical protein ACFQZE_07360 [Paenibacillus sp. GCM10027627]|uniref:hypothetical protein n=1 Tax=unclassified Paenibacillus TaxID=185978 RepID=UPI00363AA70D